MKKSFIERYTYSVLELTVVYGLGDWRTCALRAQPPVCDVLLFQVSICHHRNNCRMSASFACSCTEMVVVISYNDATAVSLVRCCTELGDGGGRRLLHLQCYDSRVTCTVLRRAGW